ncbi:unnamed protein product [Leptosia nina]|uniref:Calponin-homology (CH) domain-containing protein n=1 Tax=Leptosia nina TaxID=320188 RepID=A0AAV1JKI9_9NEOP
MPLQVLLLQDNMLLSLPKEIGKMTTLAELDASNNRLTQVPMTLGDCTGLRCLNLSNNQLGLLPLQITYLRLEHLDVSCNCISSLPLELRNMSTIITLNLDNNPLVSPPTTICMRGRVHIFKYLDNMANKDSLTHRRVEETRRGTKHTSFNSPGQGQITSGNATIDCLRHKPRHVVDSGYSTDGVDKRWSNDAGGEGGGGSGRSTPSTPSTLSPGAALSRAQSLSSESPLAPLTPILTGIRISPEGNGEDKSKLAHQQTYRQYKEALRQQRQQDVYRPRTDQPSPELDSSPQSQNQSPVHFQKSNSPVNGYSNVSFQNGGEKIEENKRPVQKVVPSRNVTKTFTPVNVNVDYARVNGDAVYSKPTSPTKSPTNTLGYKSTLPRQNGDAKLLTTSVSYLKGGAKAPSKMAWNNAVPDKLSFTMKREFDKQKEELDLLHQLRSIIESRLKMSLPEQLAPVLADGVVLCHLANQLRPRSVASVHVPSPAQPKLTMARCRRNVDNFLEACRKIGVEEDAICSPEDILCHHPDLAMGEHSVLPLTCTITSLLEHAHRSSPNESINRSYDSTDIAESIEVNYERRGRYNEDRYIANFNSCDAFDENDEDGTEEEFYANELRSRGPYYNRIQFVTPFKADGILKGETYEILDTDEVDFPIDPRENLERYDRQKMNLDIADNLNASVETVKEFENRLFFTKLMCCAADVLEGKGTVQVAITVTELVRRHSVIKEALSPSSIPIATPPT